MTFPEFLRWRPLTDTGCWLSIHFQNGSLKLIMNRRELLKTAGAVGAASLMDTAAFSQAKKPRQAVIILGESVRADMLNCYRKTGLRTPNLDQLAGQGIRFDKAYNCQPVCAPARSAIWTGLFPHTNGVWGNSMPLGDTVHTLGQHLHRI